MSIGFHVSKSVDCSGRKVSRKMSAAIKEAAEFLTNYEFIGSSFQIFVTGPQGYKQTVDDDDITSCSKIIAEKRLAVVIHGAYPDYPWKEARGAIHNIKQELRISHRMGCRGVIVHLGKDIGEDINNCGAGAIKIEDTVTARVLREISNVVEEVQASQILYLEVNAAKSSSATFETTAKICQLFRQIAALNLPMRVGFCIDTAHLFSCGVSLDTYERAQKWLDDLTEGLREFNTPIMLHLNDSASTLGSGKDEHAGLCAGNIWGAYNPQSFDKSGLAAILGWAEMNDVIIILERDNESIAADLKLVYDMGFYR